MSVVHQLLHHAGAPLAQDIRDLFLGIETAGSEHLPEKFERLADLALYCADSGCKLGTVFLGAPLVHIHRKAHVTAVQLDKSVELLSRVRGCIHLSEQLAKEIHGRYVLAAQAGNVKVERDIAYPRRRQLVAQQRDAVKAVRARRVFLRLRADVGKLQSRQRGQGLLSVCGTLPGIQRGLLRLYGLAVRLAPRCGYALELLHVPLAPLLSHTVRRDHYNLTGVGIVQQHGADELLKIALGHFGAQRVEQTADLHQRFRLTAAQPAVEHVETDTQALRIVTVIPLSHLELQVSHSGLQLITVKSVFGEAGEHRAQLLPRRSYVVLSNVADFKLYERLGAAVPDHHADGLTQPGGKHLTRQHRLVVPAEHSA